mgnify:CR=1 FL=1
MNVSIVYAGESVGLEDIDDGVWNVYFGPLTLDRLLETHMRIENAYGRLKRHRVHPMSLDSFVTYLPNRSFPRLTGDHTAHTITSRTAPNMLEGESLLFCDQKNLCSSGGDRHGMGQCLLRPC